MNDIEARFAQHAAGLQILEIISLIFLLLIVSETVWDVLTGRRAKLSETGANVAIALVNGLLERTAFGAIFVIGLAIAEPFALWSIPQTWWSWCLALLAADFTYYWMHRFEHEVRVLWAYHSVHHSSHEFNLTTALRLAWVEGLIEWLFFVPMILLGFDLVQTIICLAIVVAYQTWIHTEKVGKLGWLDRVFNTPSVHRVHHGCNEEYLDKNYGGILIVWDRLFGTYKEEGAKVTYGITEPLGTANPNRINMPEFASILRDVSRARPLAAACNYLFGRPGRRPPD